MPAFAADIRRLRWLLAALVLAFACLTSHGARAQSCSFTISTINFGSVSPVSGGSTVDTTGTLNVSCTKLGLLGLLPVTITVCPNLDAGSGGSSGSNRLMTSGGSTVPYQLFQDAGRTQGWGAASFLQFGATPTMVLTSDNAGNINTSKTIYARLYPTGSTPVASYSSTFSSQSFWWGLNLLSCAGVTLGTVVTPSTFVVQTQIQPDCTLGSATLSFGSKGVINTDVTAQTSLSVFCTVGTPYTVGIGNGQTGTGPTARRMTMGSEFITYGLYRDSAYTLPWGSTAGTLASGSGLGAAQGLTVYGKVPAQTTPSPGSYSDNAVITLTY